MGVGGGAACLLGLYISRTAETRPEARGHQGQQPQQSEAKVMAAPVTTYNVTRIRENGDTVKYFGTDRVVRDNLDSIADGIFAARRRCAAGSRSPSPAVMVAVDGESEEATAGPVMADDSLAVQLPQLPQLHEQLPQNEVTVEYRSGEVMEAVAETGIGCRTLSMSISVSSSRQVEAGRPLGPQETCLGVGLYLAASRESEEKVSRDQPVKRDNSVVKRAMTVQQARQETCQEPDFTAKIKGFKITKVIMNIVFDLKYFS
jgi:hypothetical protein